MSSEKVSKTRPRLSLTALFAFAASFVASRAFTTLYPGVSLTVGGLHLHHFLYGIALLAVGGWLGISYVDERIDRLAAVLFGMGGGLIGDEIGLLLTLENYWTELTYTLVVVFLAFVGMLLLINKYTLVIRAHSGQFFQKNASLYLGLFIAVISIAFLTETDQAVIVYSSTLFSIVGFLIILGYFISRIRRKFAELTH